MPKLERKKIALMLTESITVCANPAYPLDGILTLPGDCTGKNETVGACKPFRDITDFPRRRGIATLRHNKRSPIYYGKQMVEELGGTLSVEEETIQDAIAATVLLKEDPHVDTSRALSSGTVWAACSPPYRRRGRRLCLTIIYIGIRTQTTNS